MTSGLASTSISTTLPSTTVNPKTTLTSPLYCQHAAAAPSSVAGSAALGPAGEELRHGATTEDRAGVATHRHRCVVGPHRGVRVEQLEQRLELVVARGLHEGVDDRGVGGGQVLARLGFAEPAPRPARELPGCHLRAAEDASDRVERQVEDVLEHVGEPLGGGERVEDDGHRLADRVGELRLVLGGRRPVDEVGLVGPGLLATRRTAAEHVQADPRHHGGQPAGEVLDLLAPLSGPCVGADQADPGLLDGVVGGGVAAEHPQRHRAKSRPLGLELLCQAESRSSSVTSSSTGSSA